jgi:hypothetical protein
MGRSLLAGALVMHSTPMNIAVGERLQILLHVSQVTIPGVLNKYALQHPVMHLTTEQAS